MGSRATPAPRHECVGRRGSNAPGAKPSAAGELAQIKRGDHVERGARADREFGGGDDGGDEGFRHVGLMFYVRTRRF